MPSNIVDVYFYIIFYTERLFIAAKRQIEISKKQKLQF